MRITAHAVKSRSEAGRRFCHTCGSSSRGTMKSDPVDERKIGELRKKPCLRHITEDHVPRCNGKADERPEKIWDPMYT